MTWEIGFSIGPVQGFVAQSRRTRDLWGSSYLLSYLSACAMRGAVVAHAEIVSPRVENDPLYEWLSGSRTGPPPRIGSVPNRFTVRSNANPHEVAGAATGAFHDAWRRIYEPVFDRFVQHACPLGDQTEAIWRRQVGSFWEIAWVAGGQGEAGGLLARRKHWRTHRLPDEPGDKCTVMPDFQELSGHVRAARAAGRQDAFWSAIRNLVGALELRDDERLCAPALVKRLFGKIGAQTVGGELDVDRWPSTVYIGAVPWLHDIGSNAVAAAEECLAVIKEGAPDAVRRHVPLEELAGAQPADFVKLDANYYHRAFLADPRRTPLNGDRARQQLDELLRKLYQAAGGAPPVYYAFLLADGDRLGRLVGTLGVEKAGAALSTFGEQVDRIVREHHGVTIYAGGDDVLAMLPVPGALGCADRLAIAYQAAFPVETPQPATLSAAVVFAHVRMPVGGVLRQAHALLEHDAKRGNRRDSLAAAVLKPGGPHCRWVTSWTRHHATGHSERAIDQIDDLRKAMTDQGAGRGFSASLLHHTRDILEVLCDLHQWRPGSTGDLPKGLDLRAYVQAELADSWENRTDHDGPGHPNLAELAGLVTDLLATSRGRRDDGTPYQVDTTRAAMDALLLARFLASGGREEEHG